MRDFKYSSCGHCQNGGGKFSGNVGKGGKGGRAGRGTGGCQRNGNKGNDRRASN